MTGIKTRAIRVASLAGMRSRWPRAPLVVLGSGLVLAWVAVMPAGVAAKDKEGDKSKPGSVTGTISAAPAKHRANAVIYVKKGPAAPAATKTVTMDQRGLLFVPRVLPIQKGWTVQFLNSDAVAHSVFTRDGEKYDLGSYPKGESRTHAFASTGVYRQLCAVHSDMLAFIVVLDTPWFAVSDKAGQFTLPALPPGAYTLGVWHEKLVAADVQVQVVAGKAARVDVTLQKAK